jgi:hypothetical protein
MFSNNLISKFFYHNIKVSNSENLIIFKYNKAFLIKISIEKILIDYYLLIIS